MTQSDIDNRFEYHKPDVSRGFDHAEVRDDCRGLAHNLNKKLPEGREKEQAILKLEEVMFWANAAIARQPMNRPRVEPAPVPLPPLGKVPVYPQHNHVREEWCGFECPWRQQFDGKSS